MTPFQLTKFISLFFEQIILKINCKNYLQKIIKSWTPIYFRLWYILKVTNINPDKNYQGKIRVKEVIEVTIKNDCRDEKKWIQIFYF